MKKLVSSLLVVFMLFTAIPFVYAERPVKVLVGGEEIETDVVPLIVEGRTLVPVRAVFEAIGAKVDYVGNERKVVAVKGDTMVELIIDSNVMKINGVEKIIDVPAMIVDNRTLVPLRACGEAFGLDVEWNGTARTAKIKMPVQVVSEMNHNGILTKYTYDNQGREIYQEVSDGYWRKYEYETNGDVKMSHSDGRCIEESYNIYGDLLSKTMTMNDKLTSYVKYTYDDDGNALTFEEFGSWSGATIKGKYDVDGKPITLEAVYENGQENRYTYDKYDNAIFISGVNLLNEQYRTKSTFDEDGIPVYIETVRCLSGENPYTKYVKKKRYNTGTGRSYFASNELVIDNSLPSIAWVEEELCEEQAIPFDEYDKALFSTNPYGWVKSIRDENGNVTYWENEAGDWRKITYDINGNKIYWEDSDGDWSKFTYGTNGNLLYYEHSFTNRFNVYKEMADMEGKIHVKKEKEITHYDDRGNLIYEGYSENNCARYTYDNNNNLIYAERKGSYVNIYNYIYDWEKHTYDEKGNRIFSEFSNGAYLKREYDENNNLIYMENTDPGAAFAKVIYDKNGNITYSEDSQGNIDNYEYKYITVVR